MPDWIVGLLLSVGAGTWLYAKINRSSGGVHPSQSFAIAGIVGVIIFAATLMLLKALFAK
jgi:hypothetical protein